MCRTATFRNGSMQPTKDEKALRSKFARDYELGHLPALQEIERRVLGCDYGGTSWTTRDEAVRILALLGLEPGGRLLDVGSGSGWPALYLAQLAGCDVVLTDTPLTGLQMAIGRAKSDGLERRCGVLAADGAALPFREGVFDAINHSDVLCCLPSKLSVLKECRRVAHCGARMVFSVIVCAHSLSPEKRRRALEAGPHYVEAPADYAVLLREADWRLVERIDLTNEFMRSLRLRDAAMESTKDAVVALLGEEEFDARRQHRRATLSAVAEGLLMREIFVAATPYRC